MPAVTESWPSVEAFYADSSARQRSPGGDCGLLWRAPGDPVPWRITVVERTREAIAVRGPDGLVRPRATSVDHELDAVLAHLPTRRSLAQVQPAFAGLGDVDARTLEAFMAAPPRPIVSWM